MDELISQAFHFELRAPLRIFKKKYIQNIYN